MVPASLNDRFVIRFCVCHENATDSDIIYAYETIKQTAATLLYEPSTEPIAENYELEKLEEGQYELKDSVESYIQSQKSLNNRNVCLIWLICLIESGVTYTFLCPI